VTLFWGSCNMERRKVRKVEIMYGQATGEKSITSEKWGLATSNFNFSKLLYRQGLREVIPTLELLSELKESKFAYNDDIPMVHCKAFHDNTGAIEMARLPKMRPHMKHINIK
jgi:hypothetical protein